MKLINKEVAPMYNSIFVDSWCNWLYNKPCCDLGEVGFAVLEIYKTPIKSWEYWGLSRTHWMTLCSTQGPKFEDIRGRAFWDFGYYPSPFYPP